MKNTFLKSSVLAAASLVLCTLPARAQVTAEPLIAAISCTNNVPDTIADTVNMGSAVDCSRYQEIGITAKFALTGAGTSACTFKFVVAGDGTNYETTVLAARSLVITPNGTTPVIVNTNLYIGAHKSIKLSGITAGSNSAAMTNIAVIYSLKGLRKEYQK